MPYITVQKSYINYGFEKMERKKFLAYLIALTLLLIDPGNYPSKFLCFATFV